MEFLQITLLLCYNAIIKYTKLPALYIEIWLLMIKENQNLLNNINILSDGALIFMAMLLSYGIRFGLMDDGQTHIGLNAYLQMSIFVIPAFLLIYGVMGLFGSFRNKSFAMEFTLLFKANLIGSLLLFTILFLFKWIDISRWVLVIFFLSNTGLIAAKRFSLRKVLRLYREKGHNIKHVILVGSGSSALEYATSVSGDKSLGYNISGYVASTDTTLSASPQGQNLPCFGVMAQLSEILESKGADEVVAALEADEYYLLPQIIEICEKNGVKLSVIPFYFQYMPAKPYMDEIDGIPLINIRRIPLDNFVNALCKRYMDLIGALLLILLTSPIMLFAVLGILFTSPGPIIFTQERIGLGKKPFLMYKFRSMKVNDGAATTWTTADDPRKTKFGSFIRKFSIDELPQLFNVVKGNMSLVGPRPERPHFVEQFRQEVPLYMVKHQVRPGITGWAQVNGYRGDTSIPKRIKHDIYYIENWNIFFDIKILFMTLFKGIVNEEKLV